MDEGEAGSYRLWAQSFGVCVFALGLLVLVGWTLDVAALKSVLPSWVTMKANTALAFVLSGASLFLLSRARRPKAGAEVRRAIEGRWTARVLGACAALIGLLTLIEYIFGCNLGIDQLLFRETPSAVATYSPGRMALAPAINFSFTGLALTLMDARTRRGRHLAQYLMLPVACPALLALIGYLFGQTSFYRFGLNIAMALHTATAFLALSVGVLLARSQYALASTLSDGGSGGMVARRLLPVAILVPVVLGWLQMRGEQAGYFESQVGEAIMTCCYIGIMVALTLWVAGSLRRLDIEHLRVADKILRAKQEWERTFDAVPDLIAIIDDQHRLTRVNRAMAARLGVTPQKCVGLNCYEAVHGMDHPPEFCPHALTCADRQEHTAEEHMDRLGGDFLVTATPMLDPEGRYLGSVHVARDITKRKRAEEALRRSEEQYRTLVESIDLGVTLIDANYRILKTNSAQGRLFGKPVAEFTGKECFREFEKRDHVCPHCPGTQAMATGKPAEKETSGVRDDGSKFFVRVQAHPLRDHEGRSIGFIEVVEDITEQHKTQQQLMQSQKLEAIGRLAAGISHEINTPTQYIGENIRFLQKSLPDVVGLLQEVKARLTDGVITAETRADLLDRLLKADADYLAGEIPKAIEQSLQGITHVTKIVGAMKEFSHPATFKKELVDINWALKTTIAISRNEWKYVAEVVTDLEPSLPAVPGLPGDLNQVFLNLLINAAQVIENAVGRDSGRKGTITVTTRSEEGWVEIRIADTGTGIPEDIREKIFDPFFTTKDVGKGTGQGLAIARSVVVEKHGGALTFETEEGKGTTFIIRLPRSETAAIKENT